MYVKNNKTSKRLWLSVVPRMYITSLACFFNKFASMFFFNLIKIISNAQFQNYSFISYFKI